LEFRFGGLWSRGLTLVPPLAVRGPENDEPKLYAPPIFRVQGSGVQGLRYMF
jgi:hypothetical protein